MTPLQELLEQEVEAVRAVLATLQAERTALESRDAEALLSASNAKGEAVARAARIEQQRRDYMAGNSGNRSGQQSAPESMLRIELKRLAAECRQRNDANGLLIRGQRRRVEGSLNVLRGTTSAPDTYGRDGESLPVRGPRTPLASY